MRSQLRGYQNARGRKPRPATTRRRHHGFERTVSRMAQPPRMFANLLWLFGVISGKVA